MPPRGASGSGAAGAGAGAGADAGVSIYNNALAHRIRRAVPLTTFYEGARPLADDFYSSDDDDNDKPVPANPTYVVARKRLRGGE